MIDCATCSSDEQAEHAYRHEQVSSADRHRVHLKIPDITDDQTWWAARAGAPRSTHRGDASPGPDQSMLTPEIQGLVEAWTQWDAPAC